MKSLSFLSASSTLLLSCSVIAFPFDVSLSSTQISSRAISSEQCQEVPSVIDPSCWITLKVAEHLTNWKKTTPRCKENGNGVGCCISTESFSTCYLRLALGVAGYECDTLNDNFCSSSILKPSGEQNPLLRAQQGYVIACIYEIRSFLQSYYQSKVQSGRS